MTKKKIRFEDLTAWMQVGIIGGLGYSAMTIWEIIFVPLLNSFL
jgi:hypothetical protein